MEAILNVALPIFALIACGYLAGKIGVLGEDSTTALNAFVWWFALPALFFLSLARVKFDDIFNIPFLLAYGAALSLAFLGAVLAFGGPGPRSEALEGLAMYGAFCGAAAFTLFGSFLNLRNEGYKLRRIKIEPPGSSE